MKKTIRITFSDFWGELIPDDNYFYNLLHTKYNVIIDNNNPDIVFYTVYSNTHMLWDMNKVVKILYTGENVKPNYSECHYSLSFERNDDIRNYRLPLWAIVLNWFDRPYREERDQAYLHNIDLFLNKSDIYVKDKFCAFVASNPIGKRMDFIPKLINKNYKKIDCGGKLFNNIPHICGRGDSIHKVDALNSYKFNIAFENASNIGYCTEKIIHSMFRNSIPVYWGDSSVGIDFNTDSFINWHDYNDDESVIERIIEIDSNKKLYKEMLHQPWFNDNKIPDFVKPESVLTWFEKIIDNI